MPEWAMWALAVAVFVLPFVLMALFNGDSVSDSRGRRVTRRWHT